MFLTVDQVAERWQLSARRVREMAAAGEIPAIKLGTLWRFPVDALETFERRALTVAA